MRDDVRAVVRAAEALAAAVERWEPESDVIKPVAHLVVQAVHALLNCMAAEGLLARRTGGGRPTA